MMQTVQLSLADGLFAASVREALSRNCAWHVEAVDRLDFSRRGVMVVDEQAFERLPLPLSHPERVVVITRIEPQAARFLAQAWEAGIVSVVSERDSISTVLLAIMAAALRAEKFNTAADPGEITPTFLRRPRH